jgi:vacuolar-type H+-ATPase subunit D/Vma8
MLRVIFAVVLIATYALQKQRQELEEERARNRILQEKMDVLVKENCVLVRDKDELKESLDRVWKKAIEYEDRIYYNSMEGV